MGLLVHLQRSKFNRPVNDDLPPPANAACRRACSPGGHGETSKTRLPGTTTDPDSKGWWYSSHQDPQSPLSVFSSLPLSFLLCLIFYRILLLCRPPGTREPCLSAASVLQRPRVTLEAATTPCSKTTPSPPQANPKATLEAQLSRATSHLPISPTTTAATRHHIRADRRPTS